MITVLYVDDEPDLLEITRMFLEDTREFIIDTSVSAGDVLESGNLSKYDAIISDYQMPGMDGIAFLKAVRKRFGDIPFILFTGRGREEVVIAAINNGADFYLQKGGDPKAQFAELAHKIRQAVRRKKAERSLYDSERRLADIINFLPDATFAVDFNGTVIAWNRAMEKMTGVKSSEILGKGNYEYALPFYHERRPILIDLVLKDDPVTAAKYPVLTRDGTTLYSEITLPDFNNGKGAALWFTASPLYDTRGAVVGAIESIREITGRKKAEEALRESEERYRNVVEGQTEFICRFRPDGTHVFVNEAYCRYFGLKRDEILGHRFRPGIPAEEHERLGRYFASLTPDHPVDTIEHRIILPDGTIRWQRWSDRAIFDPAGTITEYQAVGQDITERKREEQALQENEQQLASIYNTVGDIIFQLTVEPHGQYRFSSVNSAFGRVTGLPPEQVSGRNVNEIIPEPTLTTVMEKYRQAIREKAIVRWEETSVYPSGQLTGEVSIAPIFDPAGNCTHLIGSVHDLTERKRNEEERIFNNIILSTQQETSLDGILIVDENAKILNYNQKFTGIWGIPDDLIASRADDPVLQLVAGQLADPAAFLSRVKYLYGHKEEKSFDELLLKDGRVLERYSAPMAGERGKYFGRVWYFRDITRRKRAEEALRKSQQQLQDAMDLAGLVDWEYDLTTGMFTFDDRFFAMAGTTAEREGGNRIPVETYAREFVHPDDIHTVSEEMEKAMRSTDLEYVSRREHRIICRDGGVRPVLILIRVRRDADRRPVKVHGTLQDLTEQKRAENALLESEERLHLALEGAGLGTWNWNVVTGDVIFNERWAEMLGYRPDEIEPNVHGWERLVHPDDMPRVLEILAAHLEGKTDHYECEHRMVHKSGAVIWVFNRGRIIRRDAGGRPLVAAGTHMDITQIKRAQEAIREN